MALRVRIRLIVENQTDTITRLPPSIVPPKLFYSLGRKPIHIKPDVSSYWRHLTLDSYYIYERIFYNCEPARKGRKATKTSRKLTYLDSF
jgi:hypothetical protein